MIQRIKYYLLKINLIRFLYYRLKYNLTTGDFVNFNFNGKLKIIDRSITIRDFSEIVINHGGFLELHKSVFLGKNIEIGADQISIGFNSSIQNNCILLGNISIGDNCLFGPSVYVSSGQHFFKYKPELLIHDQDILAKSELDLSNNKIIIEDDVWIGKNVVIINNAIVGKGSIIGANTIINKDVEPYTIVAGAPQKVIGKRLEFYNEMPRELKGNISSCFPYFYSGFDYSVKTLNEFQFVKITKNNFSICLNNIEKKEFLILEFINAGFNAIVEFESQNYYINEDRATIRINDNYCNKFKFIIHNLNPNILLKKVYFEN